MSNPFFQKNFSLLAFLILGVAAAYAVGIKTGEKRVDSDTSRVLSEARKYFQPIPEFNSISGRVLEIKDGKLVLEAFVPQNPFEPVPTRRLVGLTDSTKVVKIINKSSNGYEKEVEEYQKRLKASAGESVNVKPPSLTEETPISISEIRAGDTILAEADGSIKTKESFEAVKIIFQFRAENFNEGGQQ